ncbi:hypothetical protein [Pseudoxanthomonas sp. USHLN014]|uniref:hypothetical protein n=1 Tax=Pseudoxanthomonas sp. USHLN014 TaxID=3081297 RepID=UPI00301D839C
MIRDVSVRDVQALAARVDHLSTDQVRRHFGVGAARAGQLLALAARGHVPADLALPSPLEGSLMRKHRFSASEARAAARLILTGEIHYG